MNLNPINQDVSLDNLELKNRRILLRCDLNLPLDQDGNVSDSTRIRRLKPTVDKLSSNGAATVLRGQ